MKTTKNFKALENVLNDCSNIGDTLFAIYGVKGASESKKGGQLIFTGDPKMIADGMAQVIRKYLYEDADKCSKAIANALLNAIITVLTPKDEISLHFAELLKDAIETADKRHFEKFFAPDSKDCQECEDFADFVDCLMMRALIHQAEKCGIGIITTPTNGKGNARKTKKANKNDKK